MILIPNDSVIKSPNRSLSNIVHKQERLSAPRQEATPLLNGLRRAASFLTMWLLFGVVEFR
jgi:hypothetical protein